MILQEVRTCEGGGWGESQCDWTIRSCWKKRWETWETKSSDWRFLSQLSLSPAATGWVTLGIKTTFCPVLLKVIESKHMKYQQVLQKHPVYSQHPQMAPCHWPSPTHGSSWKQGLVRFPGYWPRVANAVLVDRRGQGKAGELIDSKWIMNTKTESLKKY